MKPILIAVFALTFSLLAHSQERVKVKISTKYGDMVALLLLPSNNHKIAREKRNSTHIFFKSYKTLKVHKLNYL